MTQTIYSVVLTDNVHSLQRRSVSPLALYSTINTVLCSILVEYKHDKYLTIEIILLILLFYYGANIYVS
jgi:hypothetical protein